MVCSLAAGHQIEAGICTGKLLSISFEEANIMQMTFSCPLLRDRKHLPRDIQRYHLRSIGSQGKGGMSGSRCHIQHAFCSGERCGLHYPVEILTTGMHFTGHIVGGGSSKMALHLLKLLLRPCMRSVLL